ncbi:MAG: hemerythrin domain-containing protein [Steroidobacteraceae bacterium]|jgi:hemerythrin-like domain-containing protein
MTGIIETLREEHRNIEELLLVLEQELSVFARNERPDYEIIQAVLSYFQDYPDCCHHPKEDMIFEKLKARDAVAAKSVGDLEAEHQNEGQRLRRVAHMIRSILTDHDVLRQTFGDIMRDFIEQERKHMEMEERVLFPAAVSALQPDDWAGIDAIWSEQKDTMFNVAIEERCQSLRERILQWERENQENWTTQHAVAHPKNQH